MVIGTHLQNYTFPFSDHAINPFVLPLYYEVTIWHVMLVNLNIWYFTYYYLSCTGTVAEESCRWQKSGPEKRAINPKLNCLFAELAKREFRGKKREKEKFGIKRIAYLLL